MNDTWGENWIEEYQNMQRSMRNPVDDNAIRDILARGHKNRELDKLFGVRRPVQGQIRLRDDLAIEVYNNGVWEKPRV